MYGKQPLNLFVGIFVAYFVFIVTATWIATPIVKDLAPSVSPTKSMSNKKNADKCAIECVKAITCKSFAFGSNQCILWEAKYIAEDKEWKVTDYDTIMKTKTGYSYYHLAEIPEATELVMSDARATYDDAAKSCQKLRRGNLVSIHDKNMQKRVEKLMRENKKGVIFWVGLNGTVDGAGPKDAYYAARRFDLRWADGNVYTASRYNHFWKTDPNVVGTACISLNKNEMSSDPYGWTDIYCSGVHYYICQYAPSP